MKAVHTSGLAGLVLVAGLLAGCEPPPTTTVQRGYRGTGMEAVYRPATLAAAFAANQVPVPLAAVPADGPRAGQVYQNVQVLQDLSAAELARVMLAITQWVAPPDQACNYCHTAEMASDALYTKVVARRMLQMVRDINTKWKSHVQPAGVTCYTCHHGNAVPSDTWFTDPGPGAVHGLTASRGEQNVAAPRVGLSSLPYDPLTPFLLHDATIRVAGDAALPDHNRHSIKQTEWTYGLMVYMSTSLGVNCTYCHNTHSFRDWDTSPPSRAVAWYGIRMARDLNAHYLEPLTRTFPAKRLGPTGDVAKVGCATCHKGVYKPLFGASMLKDYPELGPPRVAPSSETPPGSGPAPAAVTTAAAAPGAAGPNGP